MVDVASDMMRAGLGLAVSVAMAIALPFMATGSLPDVRQQIFGSSEPAVEHGASPTPASARGLP